MSSEGFEPPQALCVKQALFLTELTGLMHNAPGCRLANTELTSELPNTGYLISRSLAHASPPADAGAPRKTRARQLTRLYPAGTRPALVWGAEFCR